MMLNILGFDVIILGGGVHLNQRGTMVMHLGHYQTSNSTRSDWTPRSLRGSRRLSEGPRKVSQTARGCLHLFDSLFYHNASLLMRILRNSMLIVTYIYPTSGPRFHIVDCRGLPYRIILKVWEPRDRSIGNCKITGFYRVTNIQR